MVHKKFFHERKIIFLIILLHIFNLLLLEHFFFEENFLAYHLFKAGQNKKRFSKNLFIIKFPI